MTALKPSRRIALILALLLPIPFAVALEEYDFKKMTPSNRDQFVIHPIDRLYKAIELDDVDEIKKRQYLQYLKANTKSKYGNSALVYAIAEKSQNVIKYLSQLADYDINFSNNYGENALMMAAFTGNLPLVKLLIERRGGQVQQDGWSPIHYAVIHGNLEVVRFLLSKGAEVDALTPSETTPLMLAIRYGHIHVVKLLLDKGADLSALNDQQLTPIDFARYFNQREIARGLESRWMKLFKVEYEPIIDDLPSPR